MNIKLWLYFMIQPQIIPYEILISLMIAGMVLALRGHRFWKWRYQFIFTGLSLAVSTVLLFYFGRFTGLTYFGEAFGALVGTISSIVLSLISIAAWKKQQYDRK